MTTLLYNDPHPVHAKLARHMDWELEPATGGGPHQRVVRGLTAGHGPLVLEGGMPLLEGAAASFNGSQPVLLLAADETQHNLVEPLPHYSGVERMVHRVCHRRVDGVLAMGDQTARQARDVTRDWVPVRTVYPFIDSERYDSLTSLDTGRFRDRPTGELRVLVVGENRASLNAEAFADAVAGLDGVVVDFVGQGTEGLARPDCGITGAGYVGEDELIDEYKWADVFVFPAVCGAYPVAVLEAMAAGLPVITTDSVGVSGRVRDVHPRCVTSGTDAEAVGEVVAWMRDVSVEFRIQLGELCRELAGEHREDRMLGLFEEQYGKLLRDINMEHLA